MSKGNGKFVLGTLLGAALGAVAGILYAPKSGKETRKDLGDKAKEIARKGKDFAERESKELKEKAEKVVEDIKK